MRTTLENGLKVVLAEDHSAPVVALYVWVRTGSADERPDEAGMAHVFEHMLFKGTQKRAVGEIAATVEAAGGDINAFTSLDMTVYHITMASRDTQTGVDVLVDALRNSSFDPEELAKESEVVIEEINRGRDQPSTVLSEALFSTAYAQHPYRLPVIGTEASVRSFQRNQLLDFYRRWYAPNNMTFVAVGDFESQRLLAQIREAFAGAQPSRDLHGARGTEPTQKSVRVRVLREAFEQARFGLAYPITRFADDDSAYLDLLSIVLGEGDSSRLYRSVKDRQQLVYEIHASSYTPLDPGLLLVEAMLEPEDMESALRATRAEIERLRSFGPSAVELERARTNLLATTVHEKETVQGQASKIGFYETVGGGVENEAPYLERVRSAKVADLRRVAQQYLSPERATAVVLLPKESRPDLDEARLRAVLEQSSGVGRAPACTELAAGIRRYELPNGLRVMVKPTRSVPLVALRIAFLGGQLAETEATQGLTGFVAEMLERGTEQRSAAQIAAEIEGIAGALGGFAGRNSFGLTAEFLVESLDSGLELFADSLLHPRFPEEEIEKVRADTLARIARQEDNLQAKAFELFGQGLYAGHPYRFRQIGTPETVKKLDHDALRDYYERYVDPRNAVLSVVGDVDPDQIVATLQSYLAEWQVDGEPAPVLPARPAPAKNASPVERELAKNKNQAHLVIGFRGVSFRDPDAPAVEVLTQLLSGQSGRLFLELRDKQSLAYTTTAFATPGYDPGSFGTYIACSPDKLGEAREGMVRELRRILAEPIPEPEIEKARRYLIGAQAVSLQDYSAQANLLAIDELFGMGAAHYLGYEQRISAVTAEDLKRVARRLIDLDTPIVAVVK